MAGQYLPTAVVGSYSMPAWLERAKNDFLRRRITAHDLDEMHDAAVKAAIKDQEAAGLDVVSDGELRRDNMIDYFATRLPGVEMPADRKAPVVWPEEGNPAAWREALGDGSFGGLYQRAPEDENRLWAAAVEAIRRRLEEWEVST